ncbi:MAG: ATP-binding protein [Verrucomicrobiaceae bacterium]|nr:ATP-binding protein [Verrucomicrobiaceae bacterium]
MPVIYPNPTLPPVLPPFVNRQEELGILDAFTERRGSQFIVVYGRRRIGKTALLMHWLGGRPERRLRGFYWVAHRSTPEILLRGFSEALAACTGVAGKLSFASWEEALGQMFALAREEPLVACIDEFPYLLESVPGLASLVQKVWDQQKAGSQLRLVLSGSQYHMMHEQFFTPRQPLYGRATASLLLQEVAAAHLPLFLPNYSPVQIVETFSVLGGVPKYLEMWDDSVPVQENIRELLLSPSTLFRHEALFLIQDEISEPRTYLAILEAIGGGLRTPVMISKFTGLAITHVGKYLHTLLALRLVRRVQSAEAPRAGQTRLSRYEICDPFLRFHFEFIHPHTGLVERNMITEHMALITPRLESYVGKTGYEELARRHVEKQTAQAQMPFQPDTIGRAWTPRCEVDVFALNRHDEAALFGECRWTTRKMDVPVLTELRAKADDFPRLKKWKKHFILFCRAGFTAELTRQAEKDGVTLVEGPLLSW